MEIIITLKDTEADLSKKIQEAINKKITEAIKKSKDKILEGVKEVVFAEFHNNKTYQAILQDDLRGQLGIVSPGDDLEHLIEYLLNQLDIIPSAEGFQLILLRPNYLEIDKDQRFIIRQNTVEPLPWLEWLLERGYALRIENYEVVRGQFSNKYSRTGLAIMVEREGKYWTIPPEHAGTANDNFITKTFMALLAAKSLVKPIQAGLKAAL